MLPYPVILAIILVSLVVISLVSYFVTGTIFSFIIVLLIAAMILYMLNVFGVMKMTSKNGELDINFQEKIPAPHATKTVVPKVLDTKEVFHISGDQYTYEDASAVCAAYDADLATFDQVQEAYSKGAEWCEYGWSQGGMALFPTQKTTWDAIQQEPNRTVCGRPGVNGGYMDPKLKLGVNCYGTKPTNKSHVVLPQPVPGSTPSKAFDQMVNKFKNMINSISLSPFNRKDWSEHVNVASIVKKATSNASSLENSMGAYNTGIKDVESAYSSL
jgi:hypothetical protein